ncbi:MAG: IclR family transcriptional regulator [Opitutales bacterium]|nr:IclR family transcriptional regulator [Opitutales bacterium]
MNRKNQKQPKKAPKAKKVYEIPNLRKAFEILEMLSETKDGITFPSLLEKTGCNKTSLFRILMTLETMGYLRKNPETDAFSISRKMLSLAYSSLCDANIIDESIDVVRALRDEIGETTMLGALLENECIMIAQEYGLSPFNFIGKLGMKSPLHASAPGKALLSALPEADLQKILGNLTLEKCAKNTITSKDELLNKLKEYSAKKYACDVSEAVDGVNCVASAIFDSHSYPVAVIWITGPANRILEEKFEELGEKVKAAAQKISERLGYKS